MEHNGSRNVFIISGLGVDQRVFQTVSFGHFEPVFLEWLSPLPNEPLVHYAARMAAAITEREPILIGLSFGGIIALEIARLIACRQVILIASARNYKELPLYYRLLGRIGLHRSIPDRSWANANALSYWLFGVSKKEEKELLARILKETDKKFRIWAIDALLRWRGLATVEDVTAIHGDKDRVIPMRNTRPDLIVKGGGHFMTVSHAEEISRLLQERLNSLRR